MPKAVRDVNAPQSMRSQGVADPALAADRRRSRSPATRQIRTFAPVAYGTRGAWDWFEPPRAEPDRRRVRLSGVKPTRVGPRVARLVLTVALMIAGTIAAAPVANASCARPPIESPHAFVGTVIDTREEDRIAIVITDEGRRVTVLGTRDDSRFVESFSSVDRRYALGGRYEFHPTNASNPYRDNACTATHKMAGPGLQPLEPSRELLPGWLPVDEQAGPVGYVLFLGSVAAAALALALLARFTSRRRHRAVR